MNTFKVKMAQALRPYNLQIRHACRRSRPWPALTLDHGTFATGMTAALLSFFIA